MCVRKPRRSAKRRPRHSEKPRRKLSRRRRVNPLWRATTPCPLLPPMIRAPAPPVLPERTSCSSSSGTSIPCRPRQYRRGMCLIRSGQGKVLPPALQRSNTFLCVPPESSRIPTLISTTSSEVSWKSVRKRLLKEVMGARQRRSGAGLSDQPQQDSPTVSRERSQRIERPAHGATPTLICQLMRTERLRLRRMHGSKSRAPDQRTPSRPPHDSGTRLRWIPPPTLSPRTSTLRSNGRRRQRTIGDRTR